MKRLFYANLVLLCVILCACSKSDKKDDSGGEALTLPRNFDFQQLKLADGATSFELSGVTFYGANGGYNNTTKEWNNCASPSNGAIHWRASGDPYPGVELAYGPEFNCLIGDVSKLPAIKKITVKLFNNSGTTTQVSVCDGSNMIARSSTWTGENPEVTCVLEVGNKKATKILVSSFEAILYSIKVE